MAEVRIPIRLSDGTRLEVGDCEFDLLIHLLYKYDFDRKRVENEVKALCNQLDDIETARSLLRRSLQQFCSELANKILAKSISDGVGYKKIVEDMLIDVNKIHYTIVENASDMRRVLRLRKKVFVGEEGYPSNAVTNQFEKESLHVMATIRDALVACASIAFDGPRGLPLERYIDLSRHKDGKKVIEVDKLAVIGDKRKRELAFQLMWLCYSVAKFWGAQRMFIFTLSKKTDNLALYGRFGFKTIQPFKIFDEEKATALMLDFDDLDTYEKHLETAQLLKLGKKLLNKFSFNPAS